MQDLFFEQYKLEGFIEVGPSPTPTGMAIRTLKAKYKSKDDSIGHVHRVFCASKDQKEIINLKMNRRQPQNQMYLPKQQTPPRPLHQS